MSAAQPDDLTPQGKRVLWQGVERAQTALDRALQRHRDAIDAWTAAGDKARAAMQQVDEAGDLVNRTREQLRHARARFTRLTGSPKPVCAACGREVTDVRGTLKLDQDGRLVCRRVCTMMPVRVYRRRDSQETN